MQFYEIRDPLYRFPEDDTECSLVRITPSGPTSKCPQCGGTISMLRWNPPYVIDIRARGRRWADLMDCTAGNLVVSETFKRIYEDYRLQGISEFWPVETRKVRKRKALTAPIPSYFFAELEPAHVRIDSAASGVRRSEPPTCTLCEQGGTLRRMDRIVIREDTWNGEDVFSLLNSPGHIMASERLRFLCEANNLANVYLVPAEDVRIDYTFGKE